MLLKPCPSCGANQPFWPFKVKEYANKLYCLNCKFRVTVSNIERNGADWNIALMRKWNAVYEEMEEIAKEITKKKDN